MDNTDTQPSESAWMIVQLIVFLSMIRPVLSTAPMDFMLMLLEIVLMTAQQTLTDKIQQPHADQPVSLGLPMMGCVWLFVLMVIGAIIIFVMIHAPVELHQIFLTFA